MRHLLTGIFAAALCVAAPQTADVTGTWLATGVPYAPWTIQLKQEGAKLTGTMEQNGGLRGQVSIYEGSIAGKAISFKANSPDGARAITFTGDLNGEQIVLHRSTKIVTGESQGGTGLFGTNAAPEFTIRRGVIAAPSWTAIKGMKVDLASVQSLPNFDAILESVRRQIEIVDGAVTSPEQLAFLKSVPLIMSADAGSTPDAAAYTGPTRTVVLQSFSYGKEKPVVLHELMHAYHDQKVPNGFANADIRRLYEQAKSGGQFPANTYMLSNQVEYFAMMASVYLHGSAARDPFTREAIKQKQPDCYQWLAREFGPR